jgi:hypothetical protein
VNVLGSDAQQFAPPSTFDRSAQLPVLQRFMVCDKPFAERAYDDGIRWLGMMDPSSPDTDLKLYLEHHGSTLGYWLRDTWSGRWIVPTSHQLPKVLTGFDSLTPRSDGSPGVDAFLPPHFTPSQREVDKLRAAVRVLAAGGRTHIDYDVPVWEPRDRAELDGLMSELGAAAVATAHPPPALWLRGQTTFYERRRDSAVAQWLGIPDLDISLVPSIARPGNGAMPSNPTEARRWAWFYDHVWRAPLVSWFAEHPGFRPRDPTAVEKLNQLTDDVDKHLGDVLNLIRAHPELDALDDLRQWWFMGQGRNTAIPLWVQHYGGRTTMLDLTSDVDVALYFARRTWDQTSYRFESTGVSPCIFVFAQRTDGSGDDLIVASASIAATISPPAPLPARVVNQNCGLVTGAEHSAHNLAADSVVAIIDLRDYKFGRVLSDHHIYPAPAVDPLFERLLRTRPEPPGLLRFGH